MKKKIIFSLLALSVVITGCFVLSLYPIYTPETLERPEWLEGKWINKDSTIWTFEPDTSNPELKLYSLITDEIIPFIHDNAKKENPLQLDSFKLGMLINEYKAGITKIKGTYFLDLIADGIKSESGFHIQHFLRSHSISKLIFSNDTLWISTLEDDWAKKLTAKQRKKIGLIESEKNWVITASTKDLRTFLSKAVNDTNVFPVNESYLVKIKN